MTDKEFVDDMRRLRIDHLPDGWPAVQTQQIDRLIAIIDQLTIERDEAKKNGGYTCHVCGALRTECEIAEKAYKEGQQAERESSAIRARAGRIFRFPCIPSHRPRAGSEGGPEQEDAGEVPGQDM